MSVVPMFSLGLLVLIGLALGIPILGILMVNPKSRAVVVSAMRFIGWTVGCIVMLALLGYFVTSATTPQRWVHNEQSIISETHSTRQVAGSVTAPETSHKAPAATTSALGTPVELTPVLGQVSSARPDWVDRAPGIQGQTYQVAVKSGLWTTDGECQQAIQGAIVKALDEYLTNYFGDDRAPQLVAVEPTYLREHLVKQPLYAETVDASVGSMRQLHALVEFDDELRGELHRLWRQAFVSHRLRYAAGGFGLVLAALGTLLAYLKFDLATGGQYRRRLRWASGLAILLVAAGAVGICVL